MMTVLSQFCYSSVTVSVNVYVNENVYVYVYDNVIVYENEYENVFVSFKVFLYIRYRRKRILDFFQVLFTFLVLTDIYL